jgi:signal transduction histidine kinase
MRHRERQTYLEWVMVALMAAVSAVLVIIQYNWTGRLSRSESEHSRINVREQLRQINRAWNADLTETWQEMRPSAEEVAKSGRNAYAARYLHWLARETRPIFSRVGIESGTDNSLRRIEINPGTGQFEPWADSRGTAFAQFEMPGAATSSEAAALPQDWMVFELNLDYLKKTWLPELSHTWIPGTEGEVHVRVRTNQNPTVVIYESQAGSGGDLGVPFAAGEMFTLRGQARGGEAERRWVIEAWNQSGSLDAAVSAARWRNFGIACILIALSFAAACVLLRYTSRSRRLADMQLRFVAGVSHEMRTPLAVIRGAGQNLATGVVSDRERIIQYAQMIVKHVDQLGETIEQVLMFAAGQKRETHAVATVSVAEALNDAVEASSIDLQTSGCELRQQIAPGLPQVLGDPAALRRAFQNLITNAARHGGTGGWIHLSATSLTVNGRQIVEVRVTDGGPGIPAAEAPRIFEPFYRGERARSEQIRGAGLGLSLLHEIAEEHGGSVSVRSEQGRGAEFSMRLPAVIGRPDAGANPNH